MTLLYIALFIFSAIIVAMIANYIGIRIVGIKAIFPKVALLTAIILVIQLLASGLSYLLDENYLNALIFLLSLIASYFAWHKLLSRWYQASLGKIIGSFLIAGILATIGSLIIGLSSLSFVQSFKIVGSVMIPTLKDGDTVLVDKRTNNYELNKVVIYNYTNNGKSGQTVGRIKYTPGQNVTIKTRYVASNGTIAGPGEYTLAKDEYYIVGDNTENSIPRIVKSVDMIGVVGPTLFKS